MNLKSYQTWNLSQNVHGYNFWGVKLYPKKIYTKVCSINKTKQCSAVLSQITAFPLGNHPPWDARDAALHRLRLWGVHFRARGPTPHLQTGQGLTGGFPLEQDLDFSYQEREREIEYKYTRHLAGLLTARLHCTDWAPCSAVLCSMVSTALCKAVQCGAVLCSVVSTVQCSAVLCSVVSTVQFSAVLCSVVSTVQCGAALCSGVFTM